MISFPNAKINLGLKIKRKRFDGFHDIESIMVPVHLCDVLEILKTDTTNIAIRIKVSGPALAASTDVNQDPNMDISKENIVIKLYDLLKKDYDIPLINIYLHKVIPMGSGLGGGSSDCAFAMKMLNEMFNLGLNTKQQQDYVARLGSDCAFFIENRPMIASGRGEVLQPVSLSLEGFCIHLVKPDLHINTALAYSWVEPNDDGTSLIDAVNEPADSWKHNLVNDFEKAVFPRFPVLKEIKEKLYEAGAVYASMSGSGAAIYGLFRNRPEKMFVNENYFEWIGTFNRHIK